MPKVESAGQIKPTFEERVAQASVYLAVMGSSGVLGLLGGAVAAVVWPDLSRPLVQGIAGLIGFALGWQWCTRVGRRWLSDDEEEPSRWRSSTLH